MDESKNKNDKLSYMKRKNKSKKIRGLPDGNGNKAVTTGPAVGEEVELNKRLIKGTDHPKKKRKRKNWVIEDK